MPPKYRFQQASDHCVSWNGVCFLGKKDTFKYQSMCQQGAKFEVEKGHLKFRLCQIDKKVTKEAKHVGRKRARGDHASVQYVLKNWSSETKQEN